MMQLPHLAIIGNQKWSLVSCLFVLHFVCGDVFFSLALNNAAQVSFVSDGYPRLEENSLFIAAPGAP
jgi:hypothetical protein